MIIFRIFSLLIGIATLAFIAPAETIALDKDAVSPINRVLVLTKDEQTAREIIEWANSNSEERRLKDVPLNSFRDTQPSAARKFVMRPPTDRMLEAFEKNPNSARAKLNRYVLVEYPAVVDTGRIAVDVRADARVITAKRSQVMSVSSLISQAQGYGSVVLDNWAHDEINATSAWGLAGGWAYVAVVDFGIDTTHPEFINMSGGSFEEGNFHETLAWDVGNRYVINTPATTPNPYSSYSIFREEVEEGLARENALINACSSNGWAPPYAAGHGSAVASILAANADNGVGLKGACKNCALAIFKVAHGTSCFGISPNQEAVYGLNMDDFFAAAVLAIDVGVQAVNISAGLGEGVDPSYPIQTLGEFCSSSAAQNNPGCLVLDYAEERDVAIVASSGNDGVGRPDFPAFEPSVIGVGGTDRTGARWNRCGSPAQFNSECAANFGNRGGISTRIEIAAPAESVASAFQIDTTYSPFTQARGWGQCDDTIFPWGPDDGYGVCSGTSMSAPLVTGVVGIMRSINPLVRVGGPDDYLSIREALKRSTSRFHAGLGWNSGIGWGIPDAEIAARRMLGWSGDNNTLIKNRATPLFELYNSNTGDRVTTTIPQVALTFHAAGWNEKGKQVRGYTFSDHPDNPSIPTPRADLYVLTTEFSPYPSIDMVPLFVLSHEDPEFPSAATDTDWVMVTTESEVESFVADNSMNYKFRGRQGYIYEPCAGSGCAPVGTVGVYRAYHPTLNDYAIFPANRLTSMSSLGYTQQQTLLGYAYPNTHSDADDLIDGMEHIIGTNINSVDTDCDGLDDDFEYPAFQAWHRNPNKNSQC